MPVNHMVWVKFKPGIDTQQIEQHIANLKALKKNVSYVLDVTLGENFTERAQGYTHGISVILADKTAFEDYATNPIHVELATALRRDADVMALDYEY